MLIVGGEDHKTGQEDDADDRFAYLEAWARERFPIGEVEYRWSGQVMEPVDGLAFIGRNPARQGPHLRRHRRLGHGMTHGTIAGMLLTDLILGRAESVGAALRPVRGRRSSPRPEYLKENVNVATQYCDYVSPGDVGSADEIPPGRGAIVRHGLTKLAVYRDEQGALHGARPCARTWAASCTGTRSRRPGTAPATARASGSTARC